MSKRKRVVLSLQDKIDIIEALRRGETGRGLATKYGVGTSTISDIKKSTESILKYTCKIDSEEGRIQRKVMKKPKNELLEEVLYSWFKQMRASGQPTTGPLLCEKALQLNKEMGGDESFAASNGWLCKFKARHGIREFTQHGVKRSADSDASNSYKDIFTKELEANYDSDFVYNADVTGLYWKSLPSKSLASEDKITQERVTLLVCANATGSHKIPLLLIGKSKSFFQDIRVPLIYKYQKTAWINSEIFIDWYDNTFIPEVKKQQNEIGKNGNVLLLLEESQILPPFELLERENGMFKVKVLPSYGISMHQPMEQSIVVTLKTLYRKQFLLKLLTVDEDEAEDVQSFFQQMDLKDCCDMLVEAWNQIEINILKRAWNKLLKQKNVNSTNKSYDFFEDINELIRKLKMCQECDTAAVKEWLSCDKDDRGFQMMSSEEVIDNILQFDEHNMVVKDEIEDPADLYDDGPSHDEALVALETALTWFEKQTECDSVSLLQLKRIRDLAAVKANTCLWNENTAWFNPT